MSAIDRYRKKEGAVFKPVHQPSTPHYSAKIDSAQKAIKTLSTSGLQKLSDGQLGALEDLLRSWMHLQEKGGGPAHLSVGSAEDIAADISAGFRAVFPDSVAAQFGGETTCFNALMGAVAAERASRRFKKASKNGDTTGMIESAVDAIRGVSQSLGGAFYYGFRGTQIAAYLSHVDTSAQAATILGKACYYLGLLGNAFFTVFFACVGLHGVHLLGKDIQWRRKLDQASTEAKVFELFQKKACADPLQKLNRLTLKDKKVAQKQMHEKGLDRVTLQFMEAQKAAPGADAVSYAQARKGLEVLFELLETDRNWNRKKHKKDVETKKQAFQRQFLSEMGLDYNKAKEAERLISSLNFDALALMGFQEAEKERAQKKQDKFSRVTNSGSVELITKAARRGLGERLKQGGRTEEAAKLELAALKARVTKENTTQMTIHTALIAIGICGLISSILGFLVLNPAGITALIVFSVLVSVLWLGVDGYCFYQAWTSAGKPGIHDKKFAVLMGTLSLATFAGAGALTVALNLSPQALILGGSICLFRFIIAIVAYLIADHREAEWNRNHPTLDQFSQELEKLQSVSGAKISPEILERFKKLSKKDRNAIYRKYLESAPKLRSLQLRATELTGKEGKILLHAAKKTARMFWKEWAHSHSAIVKEQAIGLQSIADQLSDEKKQWDTSAVRTFNRQLKRLQESERKRDAQVFKALKEHVWYFQQISEGAPTSSLTRHVGKVLKAS